MENVAAKTTVAKTFGANLRRLREQKGMTFRELASAADVPLSDLHDISQGGRECTIGTAARIAAALEVELADLFHRSAPVGAAS